MPRGYRCIVVAFVGIALAASAPKPHDGNQPQNTQANPAPAQNAPPTPRPNKPDDSPILTQPCQPGEDQRQSDLCAQWKAADAASDAAWWAMAGTVVALLGTVGLYWQIHLTRKAVEDTGEATEAMREANEIARARNLADLRPYVAIETVNIVNLTAGPDYGYSNNPGQKMVRVEADVSLKNFGTSTATNVSLGFAARAFDGTADESCSFSYFNPRVLLPGQADIAELWTFEPYENVFPDDSHIFRVVLRLEYEMIGRPKHFRQIETWLVGREIFRGSLQPFLQTDMLVNATAVAQRAFVRVEDDPDE